MLLKDGRVLVVGGMKKVGHACPPLSSAEIWDPRTGTSTATGSLPEPMQYSTATLLTDGRVLVVAPGCCTDLATAYLFVLK